MVCNVLDTVKIFYIYINIYIYTIYDFSFVIYDKNNLAITIHIAHFEISVFKH